jgi:hypothetical protein
LVAPSDGNGVNSVHSLGGPSPCHLEKSPMKRLALLCVLAAVAACSNLPTETASRAPLARRADGGMTLGGGLHTPTTCKDDNGEPIPCP